MADGQSPANPGSKSNASWNFLPSLSPHPFTFFPLLTFRSNFILMEKYFIDLGMIKPFSEMTSFDADNSNRWDVVFPLRKWVRQSSVTQTCSVSLGSRPKGRFSDLVQCPFYHKKQVIRGGEGQTQDDGE